MDLKQLNKLTIEQLTLLEETIHKLKISKIVEKNRSYDNYHNPYEYGSKQNILDTRDRFTYDIDFVPNVKKEIDIENFLRSCNNPDLSTKKSVTEMEAYRFNQLPFNPQNVDNIVWSDNMPRGGYATRNDRRSQS